MTESLELMIAVRPTFHLPALLAKQAANIDHISGGRVSLNVVSSWWSEEAKKYGVHFDQHDDRYARTSEWLDVVDAAWKQNHFSYSGKYYSVQDLVLEPKPVSQAASDDLCRRGIGSCEGVDLAEVRCVRDARGFAGARGGEDSRFVGAARTQGAAADAIWCGGVCHRARERARGESGELARITDVKQNAAGYQNYQDWLANTQLEQRVSLEDYSVSNRGLRSGLVGTPQQVADRIGEFEKAGADLLLLQFSPQMEEMERFADSVIPRQTAASA